MKALIKFFTIVCLSIYTMFTTLTAKVDSIINKKDDVKIEAEIKNDQENETKEVLEEIEDENYTELKKLDSATTKSQYPLPKMGDEIGGFVVDGIYDYEKRNAKIVTFTHKVVGTKAMLISNDDEDKAFNFSFATYPSDDKGVPHIFEHATLCGSENYDSNDVFFEVSNKTYNTFMNAMTYQNATMYPASSLSHEQLFSIYKVYLDGLFKPNILKSKNSLDMQAYRYVLNNANDDLSVEGVVYSEMKGNENDLAYNTYMVGKSTLFPNSFMSYSSGGNPMDIIKVTHDEVVAFHDKYYTPSNMILSLYGDIDYTKYLTYVNETYMDGAKKEDIEKPNSDYTKSDEFVDKTYLLPVSKDADTDNQTIIQYLVNMDDLTNYEIGNMGLITYQLSDSDWILKKLLREKLPEADVEIDSELSSYYPYMSFIFSNVNPEDKDTIKDIVEESLSYLEKNGIDAAILSSFINNNEMTNELEKDSHGFINEICAISQYALNKNFDLLGYFVADKGENDIEKRYSDGSINKLIKKCFYNDKKAAIVTLKPQTGLLEEQQEEMTKILKDKKDNMSHEELFELVKSTQEFDVWVDDNKNKSIIDKVRVASVSSLDDNVDSGYVYEENYHGVRFLESDIVGTKYNVTTLLFDTSAIPFSDLHKLQLLSNLLTDMKTKNYDKGELKSALTLNLYDFGVYTNNIHYANGGYKPTLTFSVSGLDKNNDKAFDLLNEILFNVDFTDVDYIRSLISNRYTTLKQGLQMNDFIIGISIANAKVNSDYYYDNYTSLLEYMKFLKNVVDMNDDDLKSLIVEMSNIYDKILNKNGLTCTLIGNVNTIRTLRDKVLVLADNLNLEKINSVNYDEFLPTYKSKTAIESNSASNYNIISMNLQENNLKMSGKLQVMMKMLDDKVLYQEFRAKRSCYGAYTSGDEHTLQIYTYRDPNVSETYNVYNNLPKILNELNVTDEELEDYKLSTYANFSYPLTKFASALIAIDETLCKWDEKRPERYKRYMNEIKSMTIADIKECKEIISLIPQSGLWTSVGEIASIEKDKSLFDEVILDLIN